MATEACKCQVCGRIPDDQLIFRWIVDWGYLCQYCYVDEFGEP